MDVVNALVPGFLDPIFDILEDNLPPALFNFILTVISHSFALCATAFRLVNGLMAKNPEEWDLQTLLPPIVTILAAYLALSSLYRTTSWLIRLTIWMIKWGTLLAAFSLGAGWLAAVNSMGGNPQDALANLGTKAAGWLNELASGNGGNGAPRTRAARPSSNYRPWKKFESPNEWPPHEVIPENLDEAQKIMKNIVDSANQVFDGSSWWWQAGKAMMGSTDTFFYPKVV
ncbi:hypothetical protein CC1G_07376 [Coprinopsis cinerea okayama7|uniref:Uncharacterized protein n=1 Tax=Coprinopsis cinerea (strain Okayama-7 / 130 / ATCC MYA-4618 / FGSC 9003) TaxID=240176 RepID=A8N6K5_COPC7|nr:hypothetical protein CC1G_07376 [Coprinopsis cinerea okayama7\|eukprot:XP_001830461.2 hypothetical protein CC1G_07376 [Coprinopsis cinerea okayama7\